jgi:drug/metabolite transporter (DMT)-like permease
MQSLMLGLVAALLWGLHDFTVRRVAAAADAAALFLVVLAAGTAFLLPFAIGTPGWAAFTPGLIGFCALTGLVYAFGVYSLFCAFAIGPVRLVAPICGAYPVLSVGFAVIQGQPAGAVVWLSVLAVLAGITIIAQGEGGPATGSRSRAIMWSLGAAFGFAVSFGMLHAAGQRAPDLAVTLIARCAGLCGVLLWVVVQRIDIKPAFTVLPTLLLMGAMDVGGMIAITAAGGYAHPEFAAVSASCFGLVTILLAWRFLGERLTVAQGGGALIVFAGIVVLGLV